MGDDPLELLAGQQAQQPLGDGDGATVAGSRSQWLPSASKGAWQEVQVREALSGGPSVTPFFTFFLAAYTSQFDFRSRRLYPNRFPVCWLREPCCC